MYLSNAAWWEQTDLHVCSPTFHVENVRINDVWLVRSRSCVLSLLLQANPESSTWLLSKCKNSAQSESVAKPTALQNPNFVLSSGLASSEAEVRSQVWINSHLSILRRESSIWETPRKLQVSETQNDSKKNPFLINFWFSHSERFPT
jgi:hypothetical protein